MTLEKKNWLVLYWFVYILGGASYYFSTSGFGLLLTFMITVFAGIGNVLIANALKDKGLIILGIFMAVSSLLVVGVYTLIAAWFNIDLSS